MKLRELLQSGQTIVAPGVTDVVTAKLIESLGFKALYMGGWTMGAQLGTSEPLLSLTEVCWMASYINRYCKLPIIIDAGAGWGEPLHVMRTVKELERAGVQAMHIEDQIFPKRATYFKGTKHIIDKELMAEKIEAAVEARQSEDFLIIARTDAWDPTDESTMEETIDRLQCYAKAGADVVMHMVKDIRYIPTLRKALPGVPMLWNQYFGGPTIQEVGEAGNDIIIFPQATMLIGLNAIKEAFQGVMEKGRLESFDNERMNKGIKKEMLSLIGLDAYWELEERTTEGREPKR